MTDPSKMTAAMVRDLWSHWSVRAKAKKPMKKAVAKKKSAKRR